MTFDPRQGDMLSSLTPDGGGGGKMLSKGRGRCCPGGREVLPRGGVVTSDPRQGAGRCCPLRPQLK